MSLIMALCLILIFTVIYVTHFTNSVRLMSKIPGPPGLPVVHNLLFCLLNPVSFFKSMESQYQNYGTISKMQSFGFRTIFICDPDDAQKVLLTCPNKSVVYTFIKSLLGEGLVTSNGEKWHQRRKLLKPAFKSNSLSRFMNAFLELTEDFSRRIETETGKAKTNIIPFITAAVSNMLTETAASMSILSIEQSTFDKFFKAVDIFMYCVVTRCLCVWLHPSWLYFLTKVGRKQKAAEEVLNEIIKNTIDNKMLQYNNSTAIDDVDFLDLLLRLKQEGKIDDDGVKEELYTFIGAGFDTTATSISLMLMRVANEPAIQEKIFHEIDHIFGDSQRPFTLADLHQLNYLECCIKESLRMYPPVPFMMRQIKEEMLLSGFKIPRETMCFINIYGVHNRPDLFPEPEKFIPERFCRDNPTQRHPCSYFPFGVGPRRCAGQKIGMCLMKIVLCGIFRKFRVQPVTRPEDLEFTTHIVLKPLHPVCVKFQKRSSFYLIDK